MMVFSSIFEIVPGPLWHHVLAAGHEHPTWEAFGFTEWLVVAFAGLITAWSIWKCVSYTIRPGEDDPDHIKHGILNDPAAIDVTVRQRVDEARCAP